MELGPSGYPFERYIGEILKHQGYEVQVGTIVQGLCVTHEVDVLAEDKDELYIIECKFHSNPGNKCDVKTPLYIKSRYDDIVKQWIKTRGNSKKRTEGWLVTNTKFSSDAIQFGNCAGLKLIGWEYPKKGSLKERIDIAGLHPLTSLTTLSRAQKQKLLEKRIVLCRDICDSHSVLNDIGLKRVLISTVLKEAEGLCL